MCGAVAGDPCARQRGVDADRDERPIWARFKKSLRAGDLPVTHAGVLGQAWRGGSRQARLAHALENIDVRPLNERLGRAAGELLAATGLSDVIDAAVVLLTNDGDDIVTSDLDDFEQLVRAAGRHVELVRP